MCNMYDRDFIAASNLENLNTLNIMSSIIRTLCNDNNISCRTKNGKKYLGNGTLSNLLHKQMILDQIQVGGGKIFMKTFGSHGQVMSYINDPSNEVENVISVVGNGKQFDVTFMVSDQKYQKYQEKIMKKKIQNVLRTLRAWLRSYIDVQNQETIKIFYDILKRGYFDLGRKNHFRNDAIIAVLIQEVLGNVIADDFLNDADYTKYISIYEQIFSNVKGLYRQLAEGVILENIDATDPVNQKKIIDWEHEVMLMLKTLPDPRAAELKARQQQLIRDKIIYETAKLMVQKDRRMIKEMLGIHGHSMHNIIRGVKPFPEPTDKALSIEVKKYLEKFPRLIEPNIKKYLPEKYNSYVSGL